ncbi:hypothetical protein D3C73_1428420 [compost metagenome]
MQRAAEGNPRLLETFQRLPYRIADVEADAGAAKVSLAVPPDISAHLIERMKHAALEQALRQTKRHRGIIGPLARL